MDKALLVAGLPVVIAIVAAGVWLLSRGATIGAVVIGLGVIGLMFVMGQGLPRPDVVPRPGEEDEY